MLIEATVREQLEQVREARTKIRAEDAALHAIEESLLHWLDIHAGARTQPLPIVEPKVRASNGAAKNNLFKKLGTVSLPDAIMRALQNREGVVMTSQEILDAALAIGAATNSKKPLTVVEWILYDIIKKNKAPIRKVKPHKYVYKRRPATVPESAAVE